MAADLPNEFDVIVLGSGMPESIVAAAFSRIGQTVLHLDRNDYYSGDWASFNLQGIERWVKQQMGKDLTTDDLGSLQRPALDERTLLKEDEDLIVLPLQNHNFTNVELQFHTHESVKDVATETDEVCKDEDSTYIKSNDELTNEDINDSKEETVRKDISESSEGTKNIREDRDIVGSGDNIKLESEEKSKLTPEGVGDGDSKVNSELVPNLDELKVTTETSVAGSLDEGESKLNDITSNDEAWKENPDKVRSENKNADTETEDSVKGLDKIGALCNESEKRKEETDKLKEDSENDNVTDTEQKEPEIKIWTESVLRDDWRRFNLDLSPKGVIYSKTCVRQPPLKLTLVMWKGGCLIKVLYCGGEMVELLISSDIAKYCEFKTVTRVLTVIDGNVEKVPCSRADVFSSKKVSMLEKRMLMKFLQFCLEYENKMEEISDFLDKPFTAFLSSRKLTANIKHFVQHSIAMATDSMTTKQGLERTQKFLQSVGRYGNTAFLWSLYGSGELPQSFCRMCAVFGGTYCLRMSASSVILDKENKCQGIITTEGQRIACKYLVMESTYAPESFLLLGSDRFISRGILVADKPLLPSDSQELSMLCLPCTDDGDHPTLVLELPSSAMACPPGLYVFHLTRQNKNETPPKDDLACAIDILFQKETTEDDVSDKPKILWSVYFTQKDNSYISASDKLPDNVFLLSGPGTEVDIDRPVQEARELFKKILPEEEFLPKAPNPEDIIYVDDAEAKVSEDSSQSEFGEQDPKQSEPTKDRSQSELIEQDSNNSTNTDKVEKCNQSDVNETSNQSESSIKEKAVANQPDVVQKDSHDRSDSCTVISNQSEMKSDQSESDFSP